MTPSSLSQKIIVAGYLSIVWFYCLGGLIYEGLFPSGKNGDDIYIVIVEWNLVYAGLIWVLCFLGDFKQTYLVLKNNKPQLNVNVNGFNNNNNNNNNINNINNNINEGSILGELMNN